VKRTREVFVPEASTFFVSQSIVLHIRNMEEDIDELLEEVENKFINKSNEDKSRKLQTANTFSSKSSFRYSS